MRAPPVRHGTHGILGQRIEQARPRSNLLGAMGFGPARMGVRPHAIQLGAGDRAVIAAVKRAQGVGHRVHTEKRLYSYDKVKKKPGGWGGLFRGRGARLTGWPT